MKKYILMLVAGTVLTACGATDTGKEKPVADSETVVTDVYVGKLPAADGPGIIYELTLNAESLQDIYSLDMVYLEGGCEGNDTVHNVKGRIKHINRTVDGVAKTALKLMPVNGEPAMYFVQVNDSTLRLVNDSLQEAASGIKYDLIKR